jgi:hypothetical protein
VSVQVNMYACVCADIQSTWSEDFEGHHITNSVAAIYKIIFCSN